MSISDCSQLSGVKCVVTGSRKDQGASPQDVTTSEEATFHHVSNFHYQVATEAMIHLFCVLGEVPYSVFFDSNEYFCEGKNATAFG